MVCLLMVTSDVTIGVTSDVTIGVTSDVTVTSGVTIDHLDLVATSTSIYEITYAFLGFGLFCSQKYEYQAKLS